jgi:hypothetical protein
MQRNRDWKERLGQWLRAFFLACGLGVDRLLLEAVA